MTQSLKPNNILDEIRAICNCDHELLRLFGAVKAELQKILDMIWPGMSLNFENIDWSLFVAKKENKAPNGVDEVIKYTKTCEHCLLTCIHDNERNNQRAMRAQKKFQRILRQLKQQNILPSETFVRLQKTWEHMKNLLICRDALMVDFITRLFWVKDPSGIDFQFLQSNRDTCRRWLEQSDKQDFQLVIDMHSYTRSPWLLHGPNKKNVQYFFEMFDQLSRKIQTLFTEIQTTASPYILLSTH